MSYLDAINETRAELRELYKAVPGATQGFATLSKAVKDNGPLSLKEKEYVALGMALAVRDARRAWRRARHGDPDGRRPDADVRGRGARLLGRTRSEGQPVSGTTDVGFRRA